jgi:heme-degrading monooxygenase HmoA
MFARVVTIQGTPGQMDQNVSYGRDRVLPAMRGQPGFKGMYLLVDQKSGRALGITLWESEEALRASEATVRQLRAGAVASGRATAEPTAAEYEVMVQE